MPELPTYEDALRRSLDGVDCLAAHEMVSLGAADQRVLAEPIIADRDQPPFNRSAMDGSILLASRTETRRGDFEPFRAKMEIREVGSTAYKLGLVATGFGDCYFTRKPRNEWDVAAGVLLGREAGLRVTDLGGSEHRFNRPDPLCRGVVACASGLYAEVFGMIEAIGTLE